MSYRLINANEIANKYPEVNDMKCIYADLPNGMDGKLYDFHGEEAVIDKVLKIIEIETLDPSSGEDEDGTMSDDPMSYAAGWMACGYLIMDKIAELKGGEQG